MMNREQLQNWIRCPENMSKESHKELRALIGKYPYFELAHILLLKNLHDKQSIRFQEELRDSALLISNRKQLFLFLQNQLQPKTKRKEEHNEELISPNVQKAEDKSEFNEPIELDELLDFSKENEEIDEIKSGFEEIEFETEIIPADIEILEIGDELPETKQEELIKEEKISRIESSLNDLIEVPEMYHFGYGGNLYTLSESKEEKEEELQEESKSFTDWLKSVNSGEVKTEKEKVKPMEPEEKSKPNLDLIDNFIQNEPRINRNVKVTEKQEDISQESVRENEGFMSETLASIYVKQKLFDKALAVYQKLLLKNPEKKAYFASQIERIEKLKNNK